MELAPGPRASARREGLGGAWIAAALVLAAIGLAFLAATRHTYLQTDDYCLHATLVRSHGGNPVAQTVDLYRSWTGRFTSMFLIAVPGSVGDLTPVDPVGAYRFFTVLNVVALYAGVYVLLRALDPERRTNALLALHATAFALLAMRIWVVGPFWLTGSVIYFLSVAAFMFAAALVHREFTARTERRWPAAATLALVAVVVGFNELIAVSMGGLLVLYAAVLGWRRVPWEKVAALFAVYFGALAVSLLAPGNFRRDELVTTEKHDVARAFELAFDSIRNMWRVDVLNNKWLVAAAVAGAVVIGLASHTRPGGPRWRALLPAGLTLVATPLVHLPVFSFLTGEAAPARVLNQVTTLLWPGLLLVVAWTTAQAAAAAQARWERGDGLRRIRASIALPVALAAIAVSFALSDEFHDFDAIRRDYGPVWAAENAQRAAQLELAAARGETSAVVAPFTAEPTFPPVYQGADVGTDPAYWVNSCVASYYGLESVTAGAG